MAKATFKSKIRGKYHCQQTVLNTYGTPSTPEELTKQNKYYYLGIILDK